MRLWLFLILCAINLFTICLNTATLIRAKRTSKVPEPKRCPRCGRYPVTRRVGDHRDLFVLSCPSCGFCPAKNDEARSTVPEAIKVWNKREYHGNS